MAKPQTESAEMYLETILTLLNEKPSVRAIDVAHATGYTKPSVSRALGLLRASGDLLTDENGYLTLTVQGKCRAEKIFERHRVLTALLIRIGVDPDIAAADACKIEHVISDETFEKIKAMG